MSNLIVDYPLNPPIKRVQFSKTSSLKLVKCIEDLTNDAISKIWYSSHEYKVMKQENMRDCMVLDSVITTSILDQNLFEKVSKMDDVTLVGIENTVTPAMIKRIQARRARCINAVLKEQDNQDSTGIYDPERLARVSSHYSKSSRERARSIGKLYSKK